MFLLKWQSCSKKRDFTKKQHLSSITTRKMVVGALKNY